MEAFKNISILVLLTLSLGIMAAKPVDRDGGFRGSWSIDTAASDLGGFPLERAAAISINLKQNDKELIIERLFKGQPAAFTESIWLDGKENEFKLSDSEKATRTLSISNDGNVLSVASKYHVEREGQDPVEYARIETYVLSEDKKDMMLERVTALPDGKKETIKAIYHKANKSE